MKVIVVGGGIVGSSSAYCLQKEGYEVVLVHDDNPQQSSGETRIFRTLHEDPHYVGEARRSLRLWQEIEEDLDVPLLQLTGLWATGGWIGEVRGFPRGNGQHPLREGEEEYVFDAEAGVGFIGRARRALLSEFVGQEIQERAQGVSQEGVLLGSGEVVRGDFVVVAAGKNSRLLVGKETGERRHHVRFSFPLLGPDLPNPLPAIIDKNLGLYGVQDGPGHYAIGLGSEDRDLGFYQSQNLSADQEALKAEFIAEQQRKAEEVVRDHFPGLQPRAENPVYCLRECKQPDGYEIEAGENWLAFAGTNLYKLAPLLGLIAVQTVKMG